MIRSARVKVVQSPMRPDQPMGCGWRGWGVRERGGEQLSSQIGSSAVAAGADAGWRAPPPPPMRPQLLYLLLALTRVAGAWDALLADDGTIDLGGNVGWRLRRTRTTRWRCPATWAFNPQSAVNPAPDRCGAAHMALWHDRHRHAALPGDLHLSCWPHGPWPKDKRIGPFYIKTSPSAPAY